VGWCERGDSNPYGLPRQILSSTRTKNQWFRSICANWDSLVNMRVSVIDPLSELNLSKRPLGTKLGTTAIRSIRSRSCSSCLMIPSTSPRLRVERPGHSVTARRNPENEVAVVLPPVAKVSQSEDDEVVVHRLFDFLQERLQPCDQLLERQHVVLADPAHSEFLRIAKLRKEWIEHLEAFLHGWHASEMPREQKDHFF
jgi:hypothetical protein